MSIYSSDISKKFLASLLVNNPIILDIGCRDGADSIEFLETIPNSRVYSFDADPRAKIQFEDRIGKKSTDIVSRSSFHHIAVGNVEGVTDWFSSSSILPERGIEYCASSSLRKPKTQLDISPDLKYEKTSCICTSLDSWVKSNLDEDIFIDLIWADVNGAEEDLIDGGLFTLQSRVKYLYIEFSDKELFEGQITKELLKSKLEVFNELGVWSFLGNFGNILLENKSLTYRKG